MATIGSTLATILTGIKADAAAAKKDATDAKTDATAAKNGLADKANQSELNDVKDTANTARDDLAGILTALNGIQ